MEKLNWIYDLKNFDIYKLTFKSKALKNNRLKDSNEKNHIVLKPKKVKKDLPVVFMLSGYLGNGDQKFNLKSFELNQVQQLDKCVSEKKAPLAAYVFVDGFSSWGGSQFINSALVGNFEDMIVKELASEIAKLPETQGKGQQWALMGGSSGGYGALHLGSKFPEVFPWIVAVAPDSFFEASLKPEITTASVEIAQKGGLKETIKLHKKGKLLKQRNGFKVLNALAMAACYSNKVSNDRSPILPIDMHTGEIDKKVWNEWLKKDPIHFLKSRAAKLKKTKGVYLTCGSKDQFFLQFGSRQIHSLLKSIKVKHEYVEFDGGHFDLSTRNPSCWVYLLDSWSK